MSLKKLSDLATPGGPIYHRFKLAILEWKEAYKKRNEPGDSSVIKFFEHFGEIENPSKELNALEKVGESNETR